MKKIPLISLIIVAVIIIGVALYLSTRPVGHQEPQNIGKTKVMKPLIIKEVELQENDMFKNFYEMWAAMDVLDQIADQTGKATVLTSLDYIKEAKKELKKHDIASYKYRVVDRRGSIKKTITKLTK